MPIAALAAVLCVAALGHGRLAADLERMHTVEARLVEVGLELGRLQVRLDGVAGAIPPPELASAARRLREALELGLDEPSRVAARAAEASCRAMLARRRTPAGEGPDPDAARLRTSLDGLLPGLDRLRDRTGETANAALRRLGLGWGAACLLAGLAWPASLALARRRRRPANAGAPPPRDAAAHAPTHPDAVGSLAATLAHQYNNLCTIISGYAELAATRLPPAHPAARDLAEIRRASARAGALTSDLLAAASLQVLAPRSVDAVELVRGVVERAPESAALGAGCTAEARVSADPQQLARALDDVLAYALTELGAPGVARLTVSRAGPSPGGAADEVSIAVELDRLRLDAVARDRLFDPALPVGGHQERALGLAPARGIVRQMGGRLWAEETPGGGTRFRIALPAAGAPHRSRGVAADGTPGAARDHETTSPGDPAGPAAPAGTQEPLEPGRLGPSRPI